MHARSGRTDSGSLIGDEMTCTSPLVEAHVGVAVAVLNAHYEVADDGNARTIAGELLVGHLGIVLLRLDELVVEVKVIGVARHKLACAHEYLHKKAVQLRGSIEIVAASCLRYVGRVGCAQLRNTSQNGVGGAGAKGGMKREMGHQVTRHVLHTVTATEVHTHQRSCNLAVLVTIRHAAESQLAVYNWTDVTVKLLHYVKYSTERG